MGAIISGMLGENHFGARYGGDEFVVILRDTGKQEALAFCRELQSKLNSNVFLPRTGLPFTLRQASALPHFPMTATLTSRFCIWRMIACTR